MMPKICYHLSLNIPSFPTVQDLLEFFLLVAIIDPLSVLSAVASLVAIVTKVSHKGWRFVEAYQDEVFVVLQTMTNIEIVKGTILGVHKGALEIVERGSLSNSAAAKMQSMKKQGEPLFNKIDRKSTRLNSSHWE